MVSFIIYFIIGKSLLYLLMLNSCFKIPLILFATAFSYRSEFYVTLGFIMFCLIISDNHWYNIVSLNQNDVLILNPYFFLCFIANLNATKLLLLFRLSDTL